MDGKVVMSLSFIVSPMYIMYTCILFTLYFENRARKANPSALLDFKNGARTVGPERRLQLSRTNKKRILL